MSDKRKKIIVLLSAFCAVCVLAVAIIGYIWLLDNRRPAFRKNGGIEVYQNTTNEELLEMMDSTLGLLHPSSMRRVLDKENVGDRVKPGFYCFKASDPAIYVARALVHGWESPVNITLAGRMRTKADIARRLSSQLMMDSLDVVNALNDSILLDNFGTTPSKVFEMIVPDTYQVMWSISPENLLLRFKVECDRYWNEERVALARAQGLTPNEAVILASIISEESGIPDEYPKIASVYLTRLRRGMKLQACPTICYIYNYSIRRVLYSYLENPSPYNTYKYPGLPPTPIALPEKAHIEAVLHPDQTQYLYFCADPAMNGRNIFSTTISEHMRNAEKYHEALDSLTIARKAAELSAVEDNNEKSN